MDQLLKHLSDQGLVVPEERSTPDYSLPDGLYLKDADTVALPGGGAMRFKGFNAGETLKLTKDGDVKAAHVGADTQHNFVHKLLTEGGYTKPVLSGEKDRHGRDLGDLVNDKGESGTQAILASGIVAPMLATPEQLRSLDMSRLDRAQRTYSGQKTLADEMLKQLNLERAPYGLEAKRYTSTAKMYGGSLDSSGQSDVYAGPSYQRPDEDKLGFTKNNWKTGLSSATSGVFRNLYGSLDLLADATGSDTLKETSDAQVRKYKAEMEDLPYIRNGEAFDEKGNWKLDSFSKFSDWMVSTAAQSAPQLAASLGAALLAPVTFGASLSIPAAINIGNIYNEQKEKNAVAAISFGIGVTALDMLGIKGITGSLATKEVREQAVKQLMEKGHTKEAAEKLIISKTDEAFSQLAQASKDLKRPTISGAMARGAGAEAPTEVGQELLQYFGEKGEASLPSSPEEQARLNNRMLNAAAGGFFLGGGLSGAGATASKFVTANSLVPSTTDVQYRDKIVDKFGYVPSAQEIIQDAQEDLLVANKTADLEKMASLETIKRSMEGVPSKIGSWWADKGLYSLWGKWGRTLMKDHDHKSEDLAALSTLLGASRSLNGGSIDEQQALTEASLHNNFGSSEELMSKFGNITKHAVSSILSDPRVVSVMEELIRFKKNNGDSDLDAAIRNIDVDKKLDSSFHKYKDGIIEYANKIDNLVSAYNNKTNSSLTFEEFLSNKPLDKTKVSRSFSSFISDIQNTFGLSNSEAKDIANRVINNNEVNNLSDAVDDVLNIDTLPLKFKDSFLKTINTPEYQSTFSKYLSHDIVDNVYSLSARGAAQFVNKNLIGKEGSHLAALLQRALDGGFLTEGEAAFKARELKDYIDMRSGKFHEITNPFARGALSTLNFLSTITSLPLAAISSTVEFAQVYRNLNTAQSLKATGTLLKTFGAEFSTLFREIGNSTLGKPSTKRSPHRELLSEAGFLKEGGIGRRNDILSGYFQKWTEGFFKITGLTSVTSITRYAKLAIAADAMNHWITIVKEGDVSNPTQEVRDSREHLTRIGVDVEWLLSDAALNPANRARFDNEMTKGAHSFVNEAVVVPSQMNRPKFYSDPYLRLFTQFQGYASSFTANVLPRLIKDIQYKGSTDQSNAAATIAMMLAMSLLAIYLKDMIKYGESPPDWLKKDKEFQRVIAQAGLLGTGQRMLDAISNTSKVKGQEGAIESAYRQISNQAPVLAYINKLSDVLSAKEGTRIQEGARLLPIVGTSPQLAKHLQKLGE